MAKKPFKSPKYKAAGVKKIWLTFDDGPHPTRTDKVLDVLSAHGITACFFLVGLHVQAYPKLVARMVREGHRVCNHSYSHKLMTALSAADIREEIKRTESAIGSAMKGPKLFRPPYGAHDATVDSVTQTLGYRTVLWNVDTVDWNRAYQPTKWVAHGVAQVRARSSSVVLNHDIHRSTADNLESFIRKIKSLGGVKFMPASTL